MKLRADAGIIDIFVESAARYDKAHAQNYVAGLAATFALLAKNPLMARERLEFHPPVRMHPHRAHMIVYSELDDGDGILIIRILHNREDWRRHLDRCPDGSQPHARRASTTARPAPTAALKAMAK